jgi:hypothetical protein
MVTNRIKNLNKTYKNTSKWLLNKLNYLIGYRENKRYETNLYNVFSHLLDEKATKNIIIISKLTK